MDRSRIDNSQKGLTVLVIGTRWGTLSFQLTRPVLISSIAALTVLITLSLYALVGFVDSPGRAVSKDATGDLKDAREQLDAARKENARLRERVQSLENQFFTVGKKSPEGAAAPSRPFEASVDQFIIRYHPEEGSYRFQFVLKASGLSHGRASGHIFVILKPDPSRAGSSLSYPPSEPKNGKPQNYQVGDHFAISRQKVIKGTIRKIADPALYQTASVLIYSEEGVLLLEKNYDLRGQ